MGGVTAGGCVPFDDRVLRPNETSSCVQRVLAACACSVCLRRTAPAWRRNTLDGMCTISIVRDFSS
eukprot:5197675-Prymnesium_polylepis.1